MTQRVAQRRDQACMESLSITGNFTARVVGPEASTDSMGEASAEAVVGFVAMRSLVEVIGAFPSLVFTVGLGVMMVYWLSVLAGLADLDGLGGAEHGVEGVAKGVIEGLDGAHAGLADGAAEGLAGSTPGWFEALGGVGLRAVPVTVRITLVTIFAWLLSVLGGLSLAHAGVRHPVLSVALFVFSLLAAIPLSAWVSRPLGVVFVTRHAPRRETLVGREGALNTGRVDHRFGQILIDDGGAGLVVEARYEGDVTLQRGDRVLVVRWDALREAAVIEPLDRFAKVRLSSDDLAAEAEREPSQPAAQTRAKS